MNRVITRVKNNPVNAISMIVAIITVIYLYWWAWNMYSKESDTVPDPSGGPSGLDVGPSGLDVGPSGLSGLDDGLDGGPSGLSGLDEEKNNNSFSKDLYDAVGCEYFNIKSVNDLYVIDDINSDKVSVKKKDDLASVTQWTFERIDDNKVSIKNKQDKYLYFESDQLNIRSESRPTNHWIIPPLEALKNTNLTFKTQNKFLYIRQKNPDKIQVKLKDVSDNNTSTLKLVCPGSI